MHPAPGLPGLCRVGGVWTGPSPASPGEKDGVFQLRATMSHPIIYGSFVPIAWRDDGLLEDGFRYYSTILQALCSTVGRSSSMVHGLIRSAGPDALVPGARHHARSSHV